MLPKSDKGNTDYHARVWEHTLEGLPLKHVVACWSFLQLKFDLGDPSGLKTSVYEEAARITETYNIKQVDAEPTIGSGNLAFDYLMNP